LYPKFEAEHNNELIMTFKLAQYFEIKEIQIGFISFWTANTEIYIEPSSVIIEAGFNEDNMTEICILDKIEDKGFGNFGVTVYGKNFYSFTKSNVDLSRVI